MKRSTSMFSGILLGVLVIAIHATVCFAQSDREIREENARLRERVAELEVELDAARAVIRELREMITQLERRLESPDRDASDAPPATHEERPPDRTVEEEEEYEPPPVSIDESIPNASPRALLAALVESYGETMGDLDFGEDGTRQRRQFTQAIERWAARVNREFRSQIDWHVLVADVSSDRDGHVMLLHAVDPKTGTILGDPFNGRLTDALLRRLRRTYESVDEIPPLRIRGVLSPQVRINYNRPVRSVFDNPRFIGPYAEFLFSVDVRWYAPAVIGESEQQEPAEDAPDQDKE